MVMTWNAYRVLVGKPERKRPFSKYRLRWEHYSMNMDLKGRVWEVVSWLHVAQPRDQLGGGAVVKIVINFGPHKMRVISWL